MSTVSLGIASGIAGVAASLMLLRPEPQDMVYYKCKKNPKYGQVSYGTLLYNNTDSPNEFEALVQESPIFACAKSPTILSLRPFTDSEKIIPVCPYQPEWMRRRAVIKKLRPEGVYFPHNVKFVESTKDISFE